MTDVVYALPLLTFAFAALGVLLALAVIFDVDGERHPFSDRRSAGGREASPTPDRHTPAGVDALLSERSET